MITYPQDWQIFYPIAVYCRRMAILSVMAVLDPATGNLVAKVAISDAIGALAAVDAAQSAFPGWSTMLP